MLTGLGITLMLQNFLNLLMRDALLQSVRKSTNGLEVIYEVT